MKKLFVLTLLLASQAFVAGCPSTTGQPATTQPSALDNVDLAAKALDTAAAVLTSAKRSGLIVRGSQTDKDISLALHAADDALIAYRQATGLPAGQPDSRVLTQAAQTFWAAYSRVAGYVIQAQKQQTVKTP